MGASEMLASKATTACLAAEVAAGAQLLVHNGDISCACLVVDSVGGAGGVGVTQRKPWAVSRRGAHGQPLPGCAAAAWPECCAPARALVPHPTLDAPLFLPAPSPATPPPVSDARGFGSLWDRFFDQLAPTVRRVPYMTAVGNHEVRRGAGGAWAA